MERQQTLDNTIIQTISPQIARILPYAIFAIFAIGICIIATKNAKNAFATLIMCCGGVFLGFVLFFTTDLVVNGNDPAKYIFETMPKQTIDRYATVLWESDIKNKEKLKEQETRLNELVEQNKKDTSFKLIDIASFFLTTQKTQKNDVVSAKVKIESKAIPSVTGMASSQAMRAYFEPLREQAHTLSVKWEESAIPTFIAISMILGLLNFAIAQGVARILKAKIAYAPKFSRWEMPKSFFVYMLISLIISYALVLISEKTFIPLYSSFILIMTLVYAIQGVCVAVCFSKTKLRVVAAMIALVFITTIFGSVPLILLGVFESLFSLRKKMDFLDSLKTEFEKNKILIIKAHEIEKTAKNSDESKQEQEDEKENK